MNTHLAIIGPSTLDGGFTWGKSREHYLIPILPANDLPERIANEVGCSREQADLLARGKSIGGYYAAALVDTNLGVTDDWPSAGAGDCWYDDIFLGIADYLSYVKWCDLLGIPADGYTFPDWTQLSEAALESAREYLPDVPGVREEA